MQNISEIKRSLSDSYWRIIIASVIVVGLAATGFTAHITSRHIQETLLARAQSMAELISIPHIESLTGTESDLGSGDYHYIKERLVRVRAANEDVRFVYLMGLRGNDAFFYVDSEDPASPDYSYPGQNYPEGADDIAYVYHEKRGLTLPVESDRWGTWLSAFAPVKDPYTNHIYAVLGLDIPASAYYIRMAANAAVPFLLTLLLLLIVLRAYRTSRRQQSYISEKAFFLSFASHEIRSPLTGIAWALRSLRSGRRTDSKKTLAQVSDSLEQVLATIESVLSIEKNEYFKTKKLHKEPVNIYDIIQNAITSMHLAAAEHKVSIKNTSPGKQTVYSVDKQLFERVLTNLLSNAIKYSKPGGQITLFADVTNGHLVVRVHNDGKELSTDDQQRIFQGYYRTKDAEQSGQKGTGLGLMLSRDIISHHGGTLEVASAPGEGCTFIIKIPA